MGISGDAWLMLAIAIIGWLGIGYGFLSAIKTDNKVLGTKVNAMQDSILASNRVQEATQQEIKELQKVLVTLADHAGRMNVMDARMMAEGERFDELSSRVNKWMDREHAE